MSGKIGPWNEGLATLVIGEGPCVAAVAEALAESGSGVFSARHSDVVDEHAVAHVFDDAERALARTVGALVYADRALPSRSSADQLTHAYWSEMQSANFHSRFFSCAELARRNIAQGSRAVILHLTSRAAVRGDQGTGPAAASAGGLLNLNKSLAVEWGRDNIRTNIVASRLMDRVQDGDEDAMSSLAALAAYYCSDYASYISGTCVGIDEG